jgi:hypothetical protein
MGFECRPPTGIPPARPLPGAEAPFGSTLPSADSCSALVVSHHHDGLLRAEVTGLLHPATGQGFAAFHACPSPQHPKVKRAGGVNPRDAVHTLRRVPLISSRTASLRPLPSCRYRPARLGYRPRSVSVPTVTRRGGGRTPGIPCRREPVALPRGAGCPDSRGMGGPGLRGGPGYRPAAWRAGLRRAPVAGGETGGPCPTGLGVPGLRGGPGSLARWERGARAPKSSGFPVR